MPQETHRLLDLHERLLDISLKLNAAGNQEALLTYIIDTVVDLLRCEAGALLLFDEVTGSLRFVASSGTSQEELAGIPVPLNNSIAGKVYVGEQSVIENAVATSREHYDGVSKEVRFETRSLLAVPLTIEGMTIGVVEALNKRGSGFDDDDEHTLRMFANQAALAIRNARQMDFVQSAYRKLRNFEKFRSDFMAIASHELRTPLSILQQSLDILGEDGSELQREFAADAQKAAARLAAVIESMTQLESLRLGDEVSDVSETARIDPCLVAQEVLGEMESMLAAAGLRVVTRFLPGVRVAMDAERLRRILGSVISTAVDATGSGDTITIEVVDTSEGPVLRVADTGRGLEVSQLERVFDEYYQVEDHLTRYQGGLGIGLSVARKLAEVDGGTVWMESDGPGKGACLCLRFRG